jgi:hypothetical protein
MSAYLIFFFADEAVSLGREAPSLGNILLNSSLVEQGKKNGSLPHVC